MSQTDRLLGFFAYHSENGDIQKNINRPICAKIATFYVLKMAKVEIRAYPKTCFEARARANGSQARRAKQAYPLRYGDTAMQRNEACDSCSRAKPE